MITLFGAPGAGKSVQGRLLSSKYGWEWIDVRSLLLGLNDPDITRALTIGMSVDDKKATAAVQDILSRVQRSRHRMVYSLFNGTPMLRTEVEPGREIVLDGFPFDHNQVKWMIDNGQIKNLKGAIVLQVPRGQIWQRLVARKRVDDTRAAIERREDIYDRSVTGMIRTLSMNNVQIGYVNGVGSEQDVLERIEEVLGDWGLVPKKQYDKISLDRAKAKAGLVNSNMNLYPIR
jgi:adenylate kinase family enzyme